MTKYWQYQQQSLEVVKGFLLWALWEKTPNTPENPKTCSNQSVGIAMRSFTIRKRWKCLDLRSIHQREILLSRISTVVASAFPLAKKTPRNSWSRSLLVNRVYKHNMLKMSTKKATFRQTAHLPQKVNQSDQVISINNISLKWTAFMKSKAISKLTNTGSNRRHKEKCSLKNLWRM